jgi:hypothetical protein
LKLNFQSMNFGIITILGLKFVQKKIQLLMYTWNIIDWKILIIGNSTVVVRWDSISLLYARQYTNTSLYDIHHNIWIHGWGHKQMCIKLSYAHLINGNVKIHEFVILMFIMHILLIPKLAIYILVTYKLAYSSDIRFFMNPLKHPF